MRTTDTTLAGAGEAAPAAPSVVGRAAAGALTLWQIARWSAALGATAGLFVVVTAQLGASIAETERRLGYGLALALLVPLLLLWLLRRIVSRRLGRPVRLGGLWFLVLLQLGAGALLCLGFSESVGRALRRRGDWFLGSAQGLLPRALRTTLATSGRWLERFDAPPELAQPTRVVAVAPVKPATPAKPTQPEGPTRTPSPPIASGWFHPLAAFDGARVLPPNASCRFGAHRANVRRKECELGHCGVDLFRPTGTPVFAVTAGKLLKVERDTARGGRAGRYVIVTHRSGRVRSYYIHLDAVAPGLRRGQRVRAGQRLGTVGRTGMKRSAAHLHFAIELRRRRGWRYIDPEPLLWTWKLVGLERRSLRVAAAASRRR